MASTRSPGSLPTFPSSMVTLFKFCTVCGTGIFCATTSLSHFHRDANQRAVRKTGMRYKNNIGPQVRRRRYALGWSQSMLAVKLQIAGFDISRSGVSKIEARLSYVDDKSLIYLGEVLKVPVQEGFPSPA